jgi:hypothetical protein
VEDPYELVYLEAVRLLSQQREGFESLRTRAGMLLSAAAIASSLLGGQAFMAGRLNLGGWLAVGAFASLGLAVVTILWPRPEWGVSASPRQMIATTIEVETPTPLRLIHRELALYADAAYNQNREHYERLARWLRVAALLLNVEVAGWIIDLASKT